MLRPGRRNAIANITSFATMIGMVYLLTAGGEPAADIMRIVGGFALVLGSGVLVAVSIDPPRS